MTRFLLGIGTTLLVIALRFGVHTTTLIWIAHSEFEDAHFDKRISCANCKYSTRQRFEKGQIILGYKCTCGYCGVVGQINRENTLITIKQKDE